MSKKFRVVLTGLLLAASLFSLIPAGRSVASVYLQQLAHNDYYSVYGNTTVSYRLGYQTFTAPSSVNSITVKVPLWRTGTAGTAGIELWLADNTTYKPVSIIDGYYFNASTDLDLDVTGGDRSDYHTWTETTFNDVGIDQGYYYAIIVSGNYSNGSAGDAVRWGRQDSDAYASGIAGNGLYTIASGTWSFTLDSANDFTFEIDTTEQSTPAVFTGEAVQSASGNISLPIVMTFGGSDNVSKIGVELAESAGSYGSISYGETVNYGADQNYTLNFSPTDLGIEGGQTYKYRAYADYDSANTTGGDRLIEISGVPELVLSALSYQDSNGRVVFTAATTAVGNSNGIIYRGLMVGSSSGYYELGDYLDYSGGTDNETNWGVGGWVAYTNAYPILEDGLYIRAVASNGVLQGYSDEVHIPGGQTVTAPAAGLVGFLLNNDFTMVNGKSVKLFGSLINSSGSPCTVLVFSYGITSNASGYQVSIPGVNLNGDYTAEIVVPEENTTYYWKMGAYINGSWYWSPDTEGVNGVKTFTSGEGITAGDSRPTVVSKAASGVGLDTFTANMEMTSTGWFPVLYVGFQVTTVENNWTTAARSFLTSADSQGLTDFPTGNYSMTIYGYPSGSTVWYRGYASGQSAGVGLAVKVVLHVVDSSGNETTPTITPFDWLDQQEAAHNLNTTRGHWGIVAAGMLAVLLLVAFLAYTFRESKELLGYLGIGGGAVEAVVLGGAIFTRYLGTMAILVTVAIFAVLCIGALTWLLSKGAKS